MLKITLVKSKFGNTPRNRAIVQSLGLNKRGRSVLQHDTPSIRGMIHKVKHLLLVEEVEEQPKTPKARGHRAAARSSAASPVGAPAKPAPKPKAAKAVAPPEPQTEATVEEPVDATAEPEAPATETAAPAETPEEKE